MKPKLLLCLALVLSGTIVTSFAADPKDFNKKEIDAIWPELWESDSPDVKMPAVDSLSERQVIHEMAGQWSMWDGPEPDKLLISLETNRQVSVSGINDGKAWEKHGEWKVISNKLVLFLPEDEIPLFIFHTKGKTCNFNPFAKALMSEMQRPSLPAPQLTNGVQSLQSVLAVNGEISKAQVLGILESMDKGLLNKDIAAVVANFASNAIITSTLVEGKRTDTTKDDTSSYRRSLEAGFKNVENYTLKRKIVAVEIAPDGQKAASTSTLAETYSSEGNAEQAITTESATFEIIGGKILITEMNSKITVK